MLNSHTLNIKNKKLCILILFIKVKKKIILHNYRTYFIMQFIIIYMLSRSAGRDPNAEWVNQKFIENTSSHRNHLHYAVPCLQHNLQSNASNKHTIRSGRPTQLKNKPSAPSRYSCPSEVCTEHTNVCMQASVLPDRVDNFQPKSSPKPAHFNKNQPKILTAKIMWYNFIAISIKVDKDHFISLK